MAIDRSFPLTLVSWMVIDTSSCSFVVLRNNSSILSRNVLLYCIPIDNVVRNMPMIIVQFRNKRNRLNVIV